MAAVLLRAAAVVGRVAAAHAIARPVVAAAAMTRLTMPRMAAPAISAGAAAAVRHNSTQIQASEMREGDLMELEGSLWRVMKFAFSRTAQGRAYIQTEWRHITEPIKKDLRFRSDEVLERASLDSPGKYQILYAEGGVLTCMNEYTFEQMELPVSMLGEGAKYAHEGLILHVESYKGAPAVVELPNRVTAVITAVDDVGNATVSCRAPAADGEGGGAAAGGAGTGGGGGGKASVLSPSFKVRVPRFLKPGDMVVLDTADGKYLSRSDEKA